MTIKEIRTEQTTKFKNMDDKKLVEAYGTVNVVKKELSDLESDIKEVIIKRGEDKTGFTKGVQQTLSFPTGDVEYSIDPKDGHTYVLDITEAEFYELLSVSGLNPENYMKKEYKVNQSALRSIFSSTTIPLSVKAHVKDTVQTAMTFKATKLGGK